MSGTNWSGSTSCLRALREVLVGWKLDHRSHLVNTVEGLMRRLKLPMNAEKTRCCRVPEESMTFLGYRIGAQPPAGHGCRVHRNPPESGERPRSICRRVSEMTTRRDVRLSPRVVVARLNRVLTGWANLFTLGQVSPAYVAIDRHATRVTGLWSEYGAHAPCAVYSEPPVGEGMISSESPDAGNPHVRFDERRLETEPR